MFINYSNHPSANWDENEKNAAKELTIDNKIIDIPFPNIAPYATETEIDKRAETEFQFIKELNADAAMVQGEFTLTVAVIAKLQQAGIPCYAGCSERTTVEEKQSDGSVKRISEFKFAQFRRYSNIKA
jgi:phosphoribosylamine-glycine ligase